MSVSCIRLARLLICVAMMALLATPSSAQSTPPDLPRLPRVFVGVAVGPTSADAGARMRIYDRSTPYHAWVIEGGVALSERYGIGIEYARGSAVTGSTVVGVGRTRLAARQEEYVTLAVVRARALGSKHVSLDILGGAGILVHRHFTGSCTPPGERCLNTDGRSLYGKAPAFVAGADVPFQLGRQFAIVVQPRLYRLRRGEYVSNLGFVPWEFDHHSSNRFAVAFGGRVTWQ